MRHQFDAFQAEPASVQEALSNPKIHVLLSHEPRGFHGETALERLEVEELRTKERKVLATDGVLLSSAPNPFRPATELSLTLPAPADAKLEILAVDGRRVCVLHEGGLGAGDHRFAWRGTDADGRAVPSGTYYARLRAGNRPAVTARLVLIR